MVLSNKNFYYSDTLFKQIQHVQNRFGNEAEVYKDDPEFQAKKNAIKIKNLQRPKTT